MQNDGCAEFNLEGCSPNHLLALSSPKFRGQHVYVIAGQLVQSKPIMVRYALYTSVMWRFETFSLHSHTDPETLCVQQVNI